MDKTIVTDHTHIHTASIYRTKLEHLDLLTQSDILHTVLRYSYCTNPMRFISSTKMSEMRRLVLTFHTYCCNLNQLSAYLYSDSDCFKFDFFFTSWNAIGILYKKKVNLKNSANVH